MPYYALYKGDATVHLHRSKVYEVLGSPPPQVEHHHYVVISLGSSIISAFGLYARWSAPCILLAPRTTVTSRCVLIRLVSIPNHAPVWPSITSFSFTVLCAYTKTGSHSTPLCHSSRCFMRFFLTWGWQSFCTQQKIPFHITPLPDAQMLARPFIARP